LMTLPIIELNTAKVWRVFRVNHENMEARGSRQCLDNFRDQAISLVHSLPLSSVSLVFVTSVGEALSMSGNISRKCVILSASSDLGDLADAQVILATSVADVGVTLPNVDTVITPDIGFTLSHSLTESSRRFFKLSDAALLQRSGRTGRTNHGTCHVFRYPNSGLDFSSNTLSSESSFVELLSTGVPMVYLDKYCKKAMIHAFGIEDKEEPLQSKMLAGITEQLSQYRTQLAPVIKERAEIMDLVTNTGESPANIGNYFSMLDPSRNRDILELIREELPLILLYGKQYFVSGQEKVDLEEAINKYTKEKSKSALGNIFSKFSNMS